MIHPQRFEDAIIELSRHGVIRLHVNPEFYIGWTRWMAQSIINRNMQLEIIGTDTERIGRDTYASDSEIIEERRGDYYHYRGLSVRLAKEFR